MNLFEFYPNLIDKKITLTDLGISARVFSNWKKEGVFDYSSPLELQKELNSKGVEKKRKWVYLNCFEAIWLLIVKDLRRWNLDIKTIIELKKYLHTPHIGVEEFIKNEKSEVELLTMYDSLDQEIKSQTSISEFLELMNNLPNYMDYVNEVYFSKLAELVFAVTIRLERPSIIMLEEKGNKIFTTLHKEGDIEKYGIEDFYDLMMKQFSNLYFVNIPVINVFIKLFKEEKLEKYCNYYELFSEGEKEILKILRSDDFKEITIYKENSEKYIIHTTTSIDLKDRQATELRKLLGLKQYEKAEIIYRNDKHLIVQNTIKSIVKK